MSDPEESEGFLARWARRKREAGEPDTRHAPEPSVPADAAPPQPAPSRERAAPPNEERPSVDLSALPPIESITATTDIRPFLAPGVPAELTRAALRRVWVADPQIRNFIGIAENQWDFTDPNGIPGFGALGPLDDVARLLARVMGDNDAAAEANAPVASAEAKPSPIASSGENLPAPEGAEANATPGEGGAGEDRQPSRAGPLAEMECGDAGESAATQKDDAATPASAPPTRRGHGGALPR